MSYRWVYHLHGSRLTSVLVWDHLCRTEPVKRVHTEPQMGKRSAAEACQDRRNTDTYAWKNAKNHSEIWDSNLLTKAVIHLVHVCPKAQLHAEQGTWTRARTSREHLAAPLSIWLTAARGGGSAIKTNTVLCVHSNALHQCDIINATGVTENSDTISLCFFLLLQMCVKLPEQGWAGTHALCKE